MRHFADINASKITRLECNMVMHRIDSTIYHTYINTVCKNMNELRITNANLCTRINS